MMITGSILMFAGSVAPQGWLICDGSAVSRSTYSDLFEIIGTTYGHGDGSTTFNIPDLSGRVILGSSETHPTSSTGGEESHTLTQNEMASHSHSVPQHGHESTITASMPALSHSVTQAVFKYNQLTGNYVKINYRSSNFTPNNKTASANASRSANAVVDNHPATDCIVSKNIGDCDAFNSESIGLSEAHDNMQPYTTLNYIIYVGV